MGFGTALPLVIITGVGVAQPIGGVARAAPVDNAAEVVSQDSDPGEAYDRQGGPEAHDAPRSRNSSPSLRTWDRPSHGGNDDQRQTAGAVTTRDTHS